MAVSSAVLVAILAVGVTLFAPVHAQHVHANPAPPASHSATRWATDAPLRAGMRSARDVVAALEHGRRGQLNAGQVRRLAAQLEGHVQGIFANCKLVPQADAELHSILLPLLNGARALAADPGNLHPVAPMQRALAAYARRFKDPGFLQR